MLRSFGSLLFHVTHDADTGVPRTGNLDVSGSTS
jgi:hypothetical protein